MFSQLTRRFPKYKPVIKYSFAKIKISLYSTNIHEKNYYLPTLSTLSTSITPITQATIETQKSNNFLATPRILKYFSIIPSLFCIIKRSIASLDTPEEIEQAEKWLKKFTREKIPKGKRD